MATSRRDLTEGGETGPHRWMMSGLLWSRSAVQICACSSGGRRKQPRHSQKCTRTDRDEEAVLFTTGRSNALETKWNDP